MRYLQKYISFNRVLINENYNISDQTEHILFYLSLKAKFASGPAAEWLALLARP